MKAILTSLIFCYSIVTMAQDNIHWVDIEKAQFMVKKGEKPIMLFIYADWCDHCQLIKNTTLKNQEIIHYINDNFIPVKFNVSSMDTIIFNGKRFVNKDTNEKPKHQLALYLAVVDNTIGFPTFIFMNGDLNRIMVPTRGYKTISRMELFLRYIAEKHYAKESFEDYATSFVSTFETMVHGNTPSNDEECTE